MTRWLPVVGYEGCYEVSDDGRVASLPRKFVPRRFELSQWLSKKGYPTVQVSINGVSEPLMVHRVLMTAFVGPLPDGMVTRHLDGDPRNNTLANLKYGTPSENTVDSLRHGTQANAKKTHCIHGHEFTPENTMMTPYKSRNSIGVSRTCRECHREAWRSWKRKQAG